ncbi:MAG: hypothetical protein EOQ47_03310 [Mesorhizobium sp.]|nr:MAG: hypothetical protein EOQ47_03310 [Mesorhizobium sp.]
MSPRSAQRFWDNDMHQNKDLKRVALNPFQETRFKPPDVGSAALLVTPIRLSRRSAELIAKPISDYPARPSIALPQSSSGLAREVKSTRSSTSPAE